MCSLHNHCATMNIKCGRAINCIEKEVFGVSIRVTHTKCLSPANDVNISAAASLITLGKRGKKESVAFRWRFKSIVLPPRWAMGGNYRSRASAHTAVAMSKIKTPTINHFTRKYFGSWPMFAATYHGFAVGSTMRQYTLLLHISPLSEQVVALVYVNIWAFFFVFIWIFRTTFTFDGFASRIARRQFQIFSTSSARFMSSQLSPSPSNFTTSLNCYLDPT